MSRMPVRSHFRQPLFPSSPKATGEKREKILEGPRDSGGTLGPQAILRECNGTHLYVE